jgi:alcohol dehydrogenase (NADP+)
MKRLEFRNKDTMPIVGLGTWLSSKGEVYGAVREAIKMGYRHIDCAHLYENEAEIGLAIKDSISDGIVEREDLWITSKLWNSSHGRKNVIPALKKTLRDLRLTYLDLYLIHWPVPLKKRIKFPKKARDFIPLETCPLENTWQGMEESLEKGLTRHIGVSNFSIKQIEKILSQSKYPVEASQVEMHPLLQRQKMLEFCKSHNIILTAYAPLGTHDREKVLKKADIPDFLNDPSIIELAQKHNASPAQIVLAWGCMRHTSVIPKSVQSTRILQNFKAAEIELSSLEMDTINSMNRNFRFVTGEIWTIPGSPHSMKTLWEEE